MTMIDDLIRRLRNIAEGVYIYGAPDQELLSKRIDELAVELRAALETFATEQREAGVRAEREKRKVSRRSEWESSPDNPANW